MSTAYDYLSLSYSSDSCDSTINVNDNDESTTGCSNMSGKTFSEFVENEESEKNQEEFSIQWQDPGGYYEEYTFDVQSGIKPELVSVLNGASPFDFFYLFIDEEVLQIMTDHTNLYATQILSNKNISSQSRLHAWTPTDKNEMRKFLGILGYMGIVKLTSIERYWCRKRLFGVSVVRQIMSRNRFQLLLKVWHFTDITCAEKNQLYIIEPFLNILLKKFQDVYTPGRKFSLDTNFVPFRGRLIVRHYTPQKTHKYRIKLTKLCCQSGYTWSLKLNCDKDDQIVSPIDIVTVLSEKYLNEGKISDNYDSTNLEFANKLIDMKTHLLANLNDIQKDDPIEDIQKSIDVTVEENKIFCVPKTQDRQDIVMLSNTHPAIIAKPIAIVENATDFLNKSSNFNIPIRKALKWYKRIALELIFGAALANAHLLHNTINKSTMLISEFREIIIDNLLFANVERKNEESKRPVKRKKNTHLLKKKEGPAHKVRKYCAGCYEKKSKGILSKHQVRKTTTYCVDCENQPHYCFPCFENSHHK